MSHYDDCLARVLEILGPSAKQRGPVRESSDLVADLGLSSIDVMEVIEQVEDEFDISFPLNNLPDIRTVRDLTLQLEKLTV